jgi:large subunit ribosomal protein L23Ae
MKSSIIQYPLSTEKSLRLMESHNRLVFVVSLHATKKQIKKEFETLFKVKVKSVNTMIGPNGRKKAYITLGPDTLALDIATQMGMM